MEKNILIYAFQLSEQISSEIEKGNYLHARDYSLQLSSILHLLFQLFCINSSFKRKIDLCSQALKIISSNLNQLQESLHSSVREENKSTIIIPSADPIIHRHNINYTNIIGSEDAKQILYENIVLPLSLSNSLRCQLFQGIRSSVGNVLLFGPPGTGDNYPSRRWM